jgi:hypothetical protein
MLKKNTLEIINIELVSRYLTVLQEGMKTDSSELLERKKKT